MLTRCMVSMGFNMHIRVSLLRHSQVAFMLMVMSFSSYSIPMTGLDALNARMAQATTLFLAMVAFLFVTKVIYALLLHFTIASV